MKTGCYYFLLQLTPKEGNKDSLFKGNFRVGDVGSGLKASGDLYSRASTANTIEDFTAITPYPTHRIPIFPIQDFRFHCKVPHFAPHPSDASTETTLCLIRAVYDEHSKLWKWHTKQLLIPICLEPVTGAQRKTFRLEADQTAYSGDSTTPTLTARALLVQKSTEVLREATLEIDTIGNVRFPRLDKIAALNSISPFAAALKRAKWDLDVQYDERDQAESKTKWSHGELLAEMRERRKQVDLNKTWHYHLMCVPRIKGDNVFGVMFDMRATDADDFPRETGALAAHQRFQEHYQGKRIGRVHRAYVRTALHELGHMFNLGHQTSGNSIMRPTIELLRELPRSAPLRLHFAVEDLEHLAFASDLTVRPGGFQRGRSVSQLFSLENADRAQLQNLPATNLKFSVRPLSKTLPLGAPLRIQLTLTQPQPCQDLAPLHLGLSSEHVWGWVEPIRQGTLRKGAPVKRFRFAPLIATATECNDLEPLEYQQSRVASMTLLRGTDGPLLPRPGQYRIYVVTSWKIAGVELTLTAYTLVNVAPPSSSTKSLARQVLNQKDFLFTLTLRDNTSQSDVALLEQLVADPTLGPHYAVIRAKLLAEPFTISQRYQTAAKIASRHQDLHQALKELKEDTILTLSEIDYFVALLENIHDSSNQNIDATTMASVANQLTNAINALPLPPMATNTIRDRLARLSMA